MITGPCGNHVVPLRTQPKQREGPCPLWPCIFLLPDLVIQPDIKVKASKLKWIASGS